MKSTLQTTGIFFLIALLAFGCRKNKEKEESAEIAQQNAIAESSGNEIQNIAEEAAKGSNSFSTYNSDCVVLSYDTTTTPRVITIDFGSENCLCEDGKNRRGKLKVSFEGSYFDANNVITTKTEEYYVNDNKIDGTRVATNVDNSTFTIVADATITFTDGSGTLNWESTRTRVQTEGQNTPFNLLDNVYEVSGSASGVTAQGKDYEIDITTNLVFQLGCRYIKSGLLTINSSHLKQEATIDYGSGECDNKATLTYSGKTKEITL
jgi:hypothetical protein